MPSSTLVVGRRDPRDPTTLSAVEIASAVNQKQLSVKTVVEAFIQRLEAINPLLNAVVFWSAADIRRQSLRLEARLSGEALPLAGVPVIIKDNIWVDGWPVTQGSRLFKGFIAPSDALAVARLRENGALILGLSNCPEFACRGVTENLVYGVTRNPWNLACTPGGSSGGSASAVAAGLAPLALGTDAGGSIRRPAAHTGIVGFMPAAGLIPDPVGFPEPAFGNNTIGVFARDAADVDLAMGILGQPNGTVHQGPNGSGYQAGKLEGASISALRIGYSCDLGLGGPVEPDIRFAIEAALKRLSDQGCLVRSVHPRWPENTSEARIEALEQSALAALYGDAFREDPVRFDPDVGCQIAAGLRLGGIDVAQALFFRSKLKRAFYECFNDHDVLVCAATPTVAWPIDQPWPSQIDRQAVGPRGHARFTWLINQVFGTACSVPCGLDRQQLPIGLQLISLPGKEHQVLSVASWLAWPASA
jgi:aspartyl-tRNA(Asn)/glutamyl-tRNA(Gln) amidotransferase subunit A